MCQVCEAREKVGELEEMRREKERELFVLESMIEYAKLEVRVAELEWELGISKENDGPKMEDPYVRENQRPFAAKERGK